MKIMRFLSTLSMAVVFVPMLAQQDRTEKSVPTSSASGTMPKYSSEGERVFKQNCARCHDAPQGFSSQISKGVVRHMRVRASLSESDERDLMKFLNP